MSDQVKIGRIEIVGGDPESATITLWTPLLCGQCGEIISPGTYEECPHCGGPIWDEPTTHGGESGPLVYEGGGEDD